MLTAEGAGITHSGRRRRCWYWIGVVVVVCAGSRIVEAVVDRDVDAVALRGGLRDRIVVQRLARVKVVVPAPWR